MASSTAIKEIGKLIDEYILLRNLPQEDYFMYLQMACNVYRDISMRHSNEVVTSKETVSDLGIIEMPTDMIGFCGLYIPINGEWWSFTKKYRKVTTTTITAGIETQDSHYGEGVDVNDANYLELGGRGGVNDYNFNIDWKARRIFCDGFKSDTAVLQYTSSGLIVGASTYIPQQCNACITSYIDWQREINAPRSLAMIQLLKGYYDDELQKLRLFNFMPSKDEIADAWDSSSTQTVSR